MNLKLTDQIFFQILHYHIRQLYAELFDHHILYDLFLSHFQRGVEQYHRVYLCFKDINSSLGKFIYFLGCHDFRRAINTLWSKRDPDHIFLPTLQFNPHKMYITPQINGDSNLKPF